MTRLHVRAEKLRERREPCPRRAAGEQPPREPHRVDHGAREPGAAEALGLAVEEREIEARVVRDEDGVAGELEEAPHRDRRMRAAAQVGIAQARQRADRGADRNAGIDEQLELLLQFELAHTHGADLADARAARPEPRRLEVDDHEGRVLEREIGARRIGEPHGVSPPGEPGVLGDDLVEQAPRHSDRRVPKREQPARGLLDVDRPAPLLDELHEPVSRVEPQLHAERVGEHTFDGKGQVLHSFTGARQNRSTGCAGVRSCIRSAALQWQNISTECKT